MRKFLLALIALSMAMTLVGCGSSDSTTESAAGSEVTSKEDSSSKQSAQNETKEYKVGDTVAIDGEELTVMQVDYDYKTGNEYIKADSGKKYIKVDVTIKNNSDDTISVNPFDFKVLDSNGVYHDTTYILDDSLESAQLAKGGKISGSMAFEVPKDDENLKLVYTPSFWSDDSVEIKL